MRIEKESKRRLVTEDALNKSLFYTFIFSVKGTVLQVITNQMP